MWLQRDRDRFRRGLNLAVLIVGTIFFSNEVFHDRLPDYTGALGFFSIYVGAIQFMRRTDD